MSVETPEDEEIAVVEITEAIDLHGFQPRDILDVVDAYLEAAVEKGFREVRLIHGRGKGFQRAKVQQLLRQHHLVERFRDAPPLRGGWGATLAWLRPGSTPATAHAECGAADAATADAATADAQEPQSRSPSKE